jgi:ornithine cyclodeaminase/alanine dehydrogenase-like protein (mu-crystallin family)
MALSLDRSVLFLSEADVRDALVELASSSERLRVLFATRNHFGSLGDGRLLDLIARAYLDHAERKSVLPHSVFLRFPGECGNRIIGLPAYIAGDEPTAGIKWIASFPHNIERGLERASATIILNSIDTGFPKAIMEAARISARRTAVSAVLAVEAMSPKNNRQVLGLVGCGRINYEICRLLYKSG